MFNKRASHIEMDRKKVDWHGSFAVIVTPFSKEGDIAENAYRKVVELVIEAGCHGVISAGSTGEFFLMTHDERKRVFSVAVDQAAGRVPVIAGTSAIRTDDVVDLTRYAAQVGCAGAMILPPIYIGVDDRELVQFYSRISDEADLPIMLYNSPRAVRNFLTPKLVERLISFGSAATRYVCLWGSRTYFYPLWPLVPWGQWRWCRRWLDVWRSSYMRPPLREI